jgi:putative N6-adenine-specific DNA methylase
MNTNDNIKHKIMITCAPGLGETLKQEVEALGYKVSASRDTGVELEASWLDIMKLNLELRTAFCILLLLKAFNCTHPDQLYKTIMSLAWEDIVPADGYISVICRCQTPTIKNTMFANQKIKDGIVDRILQQTGSRPDSGPSRDKTVINVYWYGEKCWVYLNTTGIKLSDRGYRKMPHSAPVQESLAAAILHTTGYKGDVPLVSPMCGSGTFAIEAALIAQDRAPGLLRSNYGFIHTKGFDNQQWQQLRLETRKRAKKELKHPIIASDIDPFAVDAAKKNAQTAGVDNLITFEVCDFAKTQIPRQGGIVILNPEYGERLGEQKELEIVYKRIGDFMKSQCSGYTGYIFTGNMELAKKIGLKASRRFVFFNANIECRLLKFDLYSGTKRQS